jgi:hypothetical protein
MGSWPGRIFMVSSLALEHVIKPGNFGSRSGYWLINIHWADTSFKTKLHAPGSSDQLHAILISNLMVTFIRCHTGLMMCLIHIDESTIHVLTTTWPSHFCVPFSEKLDSLHDRLDNWHTMHSSQKDALKWVHKNWNDILEWVHRNRNDTHYCSSVMLHGL